MTKFLTAIALTIALPAMAHAQAAPAPAPKAEDHGKMMGMMDCKNMPAQKAGGSHDMAAMKGHDMAAMKGANMAGMNKADHDKMMQSCMKGMANGTTAPQPAQQNHKM